MFLVLIQLVIYCFLIKNLQASSNSCYISRSTVQIVEVCPNSKEKWEQAAARKNCATYASQCNEPEKLQYHCVINTFINETLEVCAYAQNIVLGFCTEYSTSGNVIQQSARTYCLNSEKNPCPIFYRSTEAYKYPECYNLTKKSSFVTKDRNLDFTIKSSTAIYATRSLSIMGDFSQQEGRIFIILLLIMTALLLVLLGFQIFVFSYRVRKTNAHCRTRNERNASEHLMEDI